MQVIQNALKLILCFNFAGFEPLLCTGGQYILHIYNYIHVYIIIYICLYRLVSVYTRDFPLSKADAQVKCSMFTRILQNKILPQQQEVF